MLIPLKLDMSTLKSIIIQTANSIETRHVYFQKQPSFRRLIPSNTCSKSWSSTKYILKINFNKVQIARKINISNLTKLHILLNLKT